MPIVPREEKHSSSESSDDSSSSSDDDLPSMVYEGPRATELTLKDDDDDDDDDNDGSDVRPAVREELGK